MCIRDSPNTIQIQEFQDLMDKETKKAESLKIAYSQQNVQLAKDNSSLRLKINEMDKKLSQLIQENVILRSKLSLTDIQYKEKLSQQIQTLEDGVAQRFEEILYIFDNIRTKENLVGVSSDNSSTQDSRLRSILNHRKRSRSSTSLQFNEITTTFEASTESNSDLVTKRRRKSSRRQSMFVPSDFAFPNDEDLPIEKRNEQESLSPSKSETYETNDIPVDEVLKQQDKEMNAISNNEDYKEDADNNHNTNTNENSVNFTNSITDYSIPEEKVNSTKDNNSSSKIEVFKDDSFEANGIEVMENPSSDNILNNSGILQIDQQNKIKHSMKPRKPMNKKKIMDEVMPTSNHDNSRDLDFIQPRRTRGKTVDYKLPSLRAKMRRPTEKLVDATTVTNIHDLQVKYKQNLPKIEAHNANAVSYTHLDVYKRQWLL